jgi:hypothetical protein
MKRSPSSNQPPSAERRRDSLSGGLNDLRENVRVEHLLRMEYHVIPPDEVDAMRQVVLHSPRILKYERQEAPSSTPLAQAAGAEIESMGRDLPADNALVHRLERIEQKLDVLLEHLGVESPGPQEKQRYNVALSARGLRFRDHLERCQAGDMVYLALELPMNPTVEVMAVAETVLVVEDSRPRRLSAGRDVVLEFQVIQDEARMLIERYCRVSQNVRPRRA